MYKLIIKQSDIQIKTYSKYFVIRTKFEDKICAYRIIDQIYINSDIKLEQVVLNKLFKHCEVFKIKPNGDILW